ncbi:MAG: hypothetical protein A2Y91_00835, partial [Chloroflexi bacterium RBG_13_54_8]
QQGSFPVFFGELLDYFGWSRGSLSLGSTLNSLFMAVFGPIAGFTLNRIGPKREVIVGACIAATSIALISLTSRPWHFYVTYGMLLPFGMSMTFYIPTVTTVRRWFSRKAGIAVSLALTGSGVGLAVGPHVARALIDSLGWQTAYRLSAVILALGVIVCALLLKRDPESAGTHPDGISLDNSDTEKRADFATRTETWPLKEALKTRSLWLYMVAQAGYMVVVLAMLAHLKVWAEKDLKLAAGYAAAMFSLLAGMAVVGRLFGGILSDRLMDRFGRKPILYFSICGVTVCAFLALAVDNGAMMALFAALLGLTYGSSVGVFPTYLGDLYGVRSMPVILGFAGLESASVSALGPWVFGTIYDRTGSYDLGFIIGIVFCFLSLLCLLLIKPPTRAKAAIRDQR